MKTVRQGRERYAISYERTYFVTEQTLFKYDGTDTIQISQFCSGSFVLTKNSTTSVGMVVPVEWISRSLQCSGFRRRYQRHFFKVLSKYQYAASARVRRVAYHNSYGMRYHYKPYAPRLVANTHVRTQRIFLHELSLRRPAGSHPPFPPRTMLSTMRSCARNTMLRAVPARFMSTSFDAEFGSKLFSGNVADKFKVVNCVFCVRVCGGAVLYLKKHGESVELLSTPDWTTKKADKGQFI
eukprot:454915-Rhodomonas_salina.3